MDNSIIAGATSLRNSTNHLSATNGKKRPISPEQVLRLFGQGGAAALGKALPPSHPPAPLPAPLPARRHSPASSPSSTTHHVRCFSSYFHVLKLSKYMDKGRLGPYMYVKNVFNFLFWLEMFD